MTRGFSGDEFEPAVGELRLVRGFKLWDDGTLAPLGIASHQRPWGDGPNEARCARGFDHPVPDADCTCGFYAFYDPRRVSYDSRLGHAVIAVVSMWGRSLVGSKGARAQFSQIDSVWLPPDVPADVVESVRTNYPNVIVYQDDTAVPMLHAHPLTPAKGDRLITVGRPPRYLVRGLVDFALLALLIALQVVIFLPWSAEQPVAYLVGRLVLDALLIAAVVHVVRRALPVSWLARIGAAPLICAAVAVVLPFVLPGWAWTIALVPLYVGALISRRRWQSGRRRDTTVHSRPSALAHLHELASSTWTVGPRRRRPGGIEILSRSAEIVSTLTGVTSSRTVTYYRPTAPDGSFDIGGRGMRTYLAMTFVRAIRRGSNLVLVELPGDVVDVMPLAPRYDTASDTILRAGEVCTALGLPPAALGRSPQGDLVP
ncbi:MAG: hypothetical protein JO147_14335 [Actinobacteria bacterium]|nr:hypothetical protein [Actinomycetota bacterium]